MKQKDWRSVILSRKKSKFYSNKSRSPCTEEHWPVNGMELQVYTGHFIMFSVITNIYNKKTIGPTLMEFFTATGKLKKFFFDNWRRSMLTCVWQELEYHIDVCHITCGSHIEHLQLSKKTSSVFL
jgi:hypothetical protein